MIGPATPDAARSSTTPPTGRSLADLRLPFRRHPDHQGLIGSVLAYAVLPLLTVDENDPNVAVIPIRPEPPPRQLGISCTRPQAASGPHALRHAAAEICRALRDQWAASLAA